MLAPTSSRHHAASHHRTGIRLAPGEGMALFWETQPSAPQPKPAPLSALAVALLLKLQSDADK